MDSGRRWDLLAPQAGSGTGVGPGGPFSMMIARPSGLLWGMESVAAGVPVGLGNKIIIIDKCVRWLRKICSYIIMPITINETATIPISELT